AVAASHRLAPDARYRATSFLEAIEVSAIERARTVDALRTGRVHGAVEEVEPHEIRASLQREPGVGHRGRPVAAVVGSIRWRRLRTGQHQPEIDLRPELCRGYRSDDIGREQVLRSACDLYAVEPDPRRSVGETGGGGRSVRWRGERAVRTGQTCSSAFAKPVHRVDATGDGLQVF